MDNCITEICRYILDNINGDISLDEIQNEFYYNKYYMIREFKLYTGYTIREFINTVKVLKSIDPLIFTDDTILKIALNNGFNSQEYYSEKFKDILGVSPLRFRKEYKNIDRMRNIEEIKMKKDYLLYLKQCEEQLLSVAYNRDNLNKVRKLIC